jgi:hypothetical protein
MGILADRPAGRIEIYKPDFSPVVQRNTRRYSMLSNESVFFKTGAFVAGLLILLIIDCKGPGDFRKPLNLTYKGWVSPVVPAGDESDSFKYQLNGRDSGLEFSITGIPGPLKWFEWTKEFDMSDPGKYPYIMMEYEAGWLNSPYETVISLGIVNGKGDTIDTPLLRVRDLIVDNRPHTIIIKNSIPGPVKKMTIKLNSGSSKAYLFIRSFAFVESEEGFADCIGSKTHGIGKDSSMQCLDIANRFDTSFVDLQKGLFKTHPSINDGGKYFSGPEIVVYGIPFQVRSGGMNLLGFPKESKINEEIIDHYRTKARRGSVAPISRDDKIEVNIHSPASEIYFLMAAEHPRISPRDTSLIYGIEDIETFCVELVYLDGTIDYAFPYSIRDEKHIVQGMFGAYVVPASGKPLAKVVFHNRTLEKNFYLGAVTINRGNSRLFPELIAEPGPNPLQEPKIPEPGHVDPYIRYQNGIITLGNSYIEMVIDAEKGFTISKFINNWLGESAVTLDPTPGFQVTLEDGNVDTKEIKLLNISEVTGTTEKGITLNYGLTHKNTKLEFKIHVSITEAPEIGMQMTALNGSEKELKAKVVFPVMQGIQMGNAGDVWYYYPSLRNVFSNHYGSFDHIYSLSFPMQFYDVYNPVLGGGFYLATRETDVDEMRRYGFRKNEGGVTCYIEYPKLHTLLKPNVPHAFCKTVLGTHKGEWHVAFNTYKQWLQTWYKPFNCQDKQWYRECFWLLCDYPDNIPQNLISMFKTFTWYDTITKQYRMRDILEEHKRTVGRNPDILHFWSWTYNMPEGYSRWGAYGLNGEYEKLGGVNNFHNALNDIQKNIGIKVSLYIDASLCNMALPIAKKIGPGGAMQLEGGGPVIDYASYRMCPGSKEWRDYMQGTYRRVNRELGVNVLYVDEWAPPFYYGHWPIPAFTCYSPLHGHDVPANMNLEVNRYMRELRTVVPEGAALYGEYPDVDVNAQYYDSNITYYLTTSTGDQKDGRDNIAYDLQVSDAGLSEPYLYLYKFAFPRMVQLSLPNDAIYYSWNRLKFSFLNGDAIYDSFWIRDESKAEAFMVKSHDIKIQYADCFTSNNPEPLIPSEKTGILVNKFPGKGRTLWAFYNQRYTTVRGEILKVKHVEGATYFDVWNNKPLQVRISGDYAFIPMEMYPQAVGCIVQKFNK